MKGIVSVVAVLTLAGTAFAQQPQVYTPAGSDPTVPTFMNAEVVRVVSAPPTITVRIDGRESVLSVEGAGLTGMSSLRAGDQVMLGYRVDGGRRVVTNIREVAPTAPATAAVPSRSTTIESVRVVAVNPSKRTLTITDANGKRQVLSAANEAVSALRQIRPGEDVVLSYRAGKGGTRTVVRVEPVGVGTGATATQVIAVPVPVAAAGTVTAPVPPAVVPVVVPPSGVPASGGIPVPGNTPGGPAQLQPVPNVGPPTSAGLNVALPPAGAGTLPNDATSPAAEVVRAQGVRDLQAAAGVLALKANEADGLWFAYKDQCLGGTTPPGAATTTGREWFVLLGGAAIQQPSDDTCRQRLSDLMRCADLFQQQLGTVLDGARKADVPPGVVRDVLQRNRIDR
jgi:hypothetical protein